MSAADAATVLVANYAVLTRRVIAEPVAPAEYAEAGIAPGAPGVSAELALFADQRVARTWDKDDVATDYSIQSVHLDGPDAAIVKATLGMTAYTRPDRVTVDSAAWIAHVIRIERPGATWVIASDNTDPLNGMTG